jgi:hypothetical protein
MRIKPSYLVLVMIPALLPAQEKSDLQQILERMDRLEQENRNLAAEVRALRDELAVSHPGLSAANAPPPQKSAAAGDTAGVPAAPSAPVPIQEQVAVQERRIEDLAQSKVQASQHLPVTLTGMVLFNGFLNSRDSGGQQDPTQAVASNTQPNNGAGLSQSIVGLTFQGPRIFGGGQVNGDLHLDLEGGSTSSLNHLVRLRVATIRIDWKNQSLIVGQDKPIVSPRDPSSLAQVAVSPLTAAGNPWLWQPQVRVEQRFAFGDDMGLRAQAGVYETSEPSASAGAEYATTLSPARPAVEGRFLFWKNLWSGARVEIAPGFHTSDTHVAGTSVPSRLFTIDWLIQPVAKLQLTGMFFTGENAAGIGALRQGFTIFSGGRVRPVGTAGGWTQLSYFATHRLTFNFYGGQESNHPEDLLLGEISRNFAYAGNVVYQLGPNILLGWEASQVRTSYLGSGNRVANHYDLALAYLF